MLLRNIYKDPKHKIPLLIAKHYPLTLCNSLFVPVYSIVACHFSSVKWPTGIVLILYQYVQGMCMCDEGAKAMDFLYSLLCLSMYRVLNRHTPKLFVCHIQHLRGNIKLDGLRQRPS